MDVPPPLLALPTTNDVTYLVMLWRYNAPVTIAALHAAFGDDRPVNTVIKTLQRLVQRGLVRRVSERPSLYEAVYTPMELGEAMTMHCYRMLRRAWERKENEHGYS